MVAGGRELVDTSVGVTVGDVDFAGVVQRDAGRHVEWVGAAHHLVPRVGVEGGIVGAGIGAVTVVADGHHHLTVLGELEDLTHVAVHEPHVSPLVDDDGMGKLEHAGGPRI